MDGVAAIGGSESGLDRCTPGGHLVEYADIEITVQGHGQ